MTLRIKHFPCTPNRCKNHKTIEPRRGNNVPLLFCLLPSALFQHPNCFCREPAHGTLRDFHITGSFGTTPAHDVPTIQHTSQIWLVQGLDGCLDPFLFGCQWSAAFSYRAASARARSRSRCRVVSALTLNSAWRISARIVFNSRLLRRKFLNCSRVTIFRSSRFSHRIVFVVHSSTPPSCVLQRKIIPHGSVSRGPSDDLWMGGVSSAL